MGYRYFDSASKPVQFPFGHGLSYTQFDFGTASLSQSEMPTGGSVELRLAITNSGAMAGAEVVQLYVRAQHSQVYRPLQELKGFQKLFLQPRETAIATFTLDADTFRYFDQGHRQWMVEAGEYELCMGSSSRDIRQIVTLTVLSDATPSSKAMAIHGPDLGRAHHVDDYTFAAMLDKPVPVPEASRPFHENSSVAEVGETWIGAKFKAKVVAGFQQSMGGNSDNQTLNKMFEEMANDMPLRGLVLFSRGQTNMTQIRLLLALLNHHYLQAAKLWWQLRKESAESSP